jgi:hypothetical protein
MTHWHDCFPWTLDRTGVDEMTQPLDLIAGHIEHSARQDRSEQIHADTIRALLEQYP